MPIPLQWNQCGRGLLPLLFLLSLALHALANPDPGTGPGLVNSATTPTVTQAFLTTTAATGPGSGPGPGEGTTMPGVTHTIPTLHHHEIDVDALPTQPTNLSEWRHDWDQYRKHLCATHVGGIPLCDLMGGVAHYDFNVSLRQLKRSHGYNGENCRARRLVQMLMHGKSQVNIGVIGASVSWGAGSSMRGLTDWVSLLTGAVQQSYPAANFTVHNGCFPGSQSFFANMCLSQMAPDNIDLMVIDYMTTDFPIDQIIRNEKAESFERMLRKALKRPTQMAVVQLQFLLFGQAMNPDDPAKMRFHQTSEDLYDTLAQYYNMPVISFRDAFWHDAEARQGIYPNGWKTIAEDLIHPNDMGHRYILDLFMWFLHETTKDLILQPYSPADEACLQRELPPPQYKDNWEETQELCFINENLKQLVSEAASPGWEFINEGTEIKKKQGYVTTEPDRTLVMRLNMSAVLRTDISTMKDRPQWEHLAMASVMISYLASYEHMGIARVYCHSGCKCKELIVDAHNSRTKTSTTFMAMMVVTALEPECVMQVTNQRNTSSGENKFKVIAVMMCPRGKNGFGWAEDDVGGEFKAEEFFFGEDGPKPGERYAKSPSG